MGGVLGGHESSRLPMASDPIMTNYIHVYTGLAAGNFVLEGGGVQP